jgi:hypothetical protein
MFVAALVTIAKLWIQTRGLEKEEWIKKMWHLYTMEYYSIVKDETVPFAGKWMELENIMLSEINQTLKNKHCMFFS